MDYRFENGVLYVIKPTKLMFLDYMQSKHSHRGAFYLLIILFTLFVIPALLTAGLTFWNCIGVFLIMFFGSIHLYEGWLTEETVHAWTV